MNFYNLNFENLSNSLTPPFLRKEKLISWLTTLLNPLTEVNTLFLKNRDNNIYKVTHNGQVYSLQAVLNDSYDNNLRRIRIVDSIIRDPLYIYPENDNKPVYIYSDSENKPVYIYDNSVFLDIDVDFIVLVPIEYKPINTQELNILLIQMRSIINYYKLASKRYVIKWI